MLRATAKKWLRPNLWRTHQYPPRPLAAPTHYRRPAEPASGPSIAVVTPSFNHAPFISETIDSLLAQNYAGLRYTVQDGGSTDDTLAILAGYGDRLDWVSRPDAGQSDAINQGFERVSGEIMAWLNSDDLLMPGALAYVARYFQAHPEVDLVYGHRIYIDVDGREIGRCILPSHDAETLMFADFVPQETLFWRRRVWTALAPLDGAYECAMDWEFILRAIHAGFRFRRLPRFLGCFRVHPAQKTTARMPTSHAEMDRLRGHYFGRALTKAEIFRGIRNYVARHVVLDRMHRVGLIKY
jgi:glycosyltransferase involved in cell wall biosynthesis